MQNLTNHMLVKINFQLDASDFIYVKYNLLTNTCLLFYLQEDLTSLREILPDFHEPKYLHKNVCLKVVRENAGELLSACVVWNIQKSFSMIYVCYIKLRKYLQNDVFLMNISAARREK